MCVVVAGCSESDRVNRDIGTTVIYFAAPQLQPQSLTEPESTIQYAKWEAIRADFDFGDMTLPLTFDEDCTYADSAFSLALGEGKCASGIVIDASDEPVPVTLHVEFTMEVKRARPRVLNPMGDDDGDGRLNADDNCVLAYNPDQQDLDSNGIGDTCSLVDLNLGRAFRDSDLDGVADVVDNCLWTPNPLQTDTSGNIPDAIGDACLEETALVRNGAVIRPTLPSVDLVQLFRSQSFLTLDFTDALSCDDWGAGCQLDESKLTFCVRRSVFDAAIGCP